MHIIARATRAEPSPRVVHVMLKYIATLGKHNRINVSGNNAVSELLPNVI